MPVMLKRGEFFGRAVAAREWGDVLLSETAYARGAFLPQHKHEEPYLTFVLDGGYREHVPGETRTCAARTLIVHAPGETHADDFGDRRARCLNVVLGSAFIRRIGNASRLLGRSSTFDGAAVASIGRRAAAELRHGDSAAALIVEGLLLELFGVLSRDDSPGRRVPAWLGEARAIVERDFRTKIVLSDVAEMVHVHPVSLARGFRQQLGMTLGDYVRELRIAYARERIAAGTPLAIVADEAGFADQSHFTRTFRRLTGTAPAAFRRGAC